MSSSTVCLSFWQLNFNTSFSESMVLDIYRPLFLTKMDYDIKMLIMNQYNSELLIYENFSEYIFLSLFKDFLKLLISIIIGILFPLHFR